MDIDVKAIDGAQIIKVEDVVSTVSETSQTPSMQMQVTPNPTLDNFNITNTSTTNCPVQVVAVYDFPGNTKLKMAYDQETRIGFSMQIDVASFALGTLSYR